MNLLQQFTNFISGRQSYSETLPSHDWILNPLHSHPNPSVQKLPEEIIRNIFDYLLKSEVVTFSLASKNELTILTAKNNKKAYNIINELINDLQQIPGPSAEISYVTMKISKIISDSFKHEKFTLYNAFLLSYKLGEIMFESESFKKAAVEKLDIAIKRNSELLIPLYNLELIMLDIDRPSWKEQEKFCDFVDFVIEAIRDNITAPVFIIKALEDKCKFSIDDIQGAEAKKVARNALKFALKEYFQYRRKK